MTRLWEPWVYWAYGAGFDRKTEQHVPEAGLQLLESSFVANELIKLLGGDGSVSWTQHFGRFRSEADI
jgi:hypothetical protein